MWLLLHTELRVRFRHGTTYFAFLLWCLPGIAIFSTKHTGTFGGAGGVSEDAPIVLMRIVAVLSALGVVTVAAFVGTCLLRDREMRVTPFLATLCIAPWAYWCGRFLGSFFAAIFALSGIVVGLALGRTLWTEAGSAASAPPLRIWLSLFLGYFKE